jgi:hypothetical protein
MKKIILSTLASVALFATAAQAKELTDEKLTDEIKVIIKGEGTFLYGELRIAVTILGTYDQQGMLPVSIVDATAAFNAELDNLEVAENLADLFNRDEDTWIAKREITNTIESLDSSIVEALEGTYSQGNE